MERRLEKADCEGLTVRFLKLTRWSKSPGGRVVIRSRESLRRCRLWRPSKRLEEFGEKGFGLEHVLEIFMSNINSFSGKLLTLSSHTLKLWLESGWVAVVGRWVAVGRRQSITLNLVTFSFAAGTLFR